MFLMSQFLLSLSLKSLSLVSLLFVAICFALYVTLPSMHRYIMSLSFISLSLVSLSLMSQPFMYHSLLSLSIISWSPILLSYVSAHHTLVPYIPVSCVSALHVHISCLCPVPGSPKEVDSRPGCPMRPFSFFPKRRPMEDLMLFFLLALWRESWLLLELLPSAERLQGPETERHRHVFVLFFNKMQFGVETQDSLRTDMFANVKLAS